MAPSGLYSPSEAREQACRDLAQVAAVRNGAAREFGLLAAERPKQRGTVSMARDFNSQVWRRSVRCAGGIDRQSLARTVERAILRSSCEGVSGAHSADPEPHKTRGGHADTACAVAKPLSRDCGNRFLRQSPAGSSA